MQLTIIKNDKNELLNRYDIIAEIEEKKYPQKKK